MKTKKGVSLQGLKNSLVKKLLLAETLAGREMTITGAHRAGDAGFHGQGEAVDIRCHDSITRLDYVVALTTVGITRIRLYDRHIHAVLSGVGRQAPGISLGGLSK